MSRVSQAVARQTRERIVESALNILINQGYNQLTFSNIAREANISRSGINAHFKVKKDLELVLSTRIGELLAGKLDFSSNKNFKKRWVDLIDNDPEFLNIIIGSGNFSSKKEGVVGLQSAIQDEDEEEKLDVIYFCIGYAITNTPE